MDSTTHTSVAAMSVQSGCPHLLQLLALPGVHPGAHRRVPAQQGVLGVGMIEPAPAGDHNVKLLRLLRVVRAGAGDAEELFPANGAPPRLRRLPTRRLGRREHAQSRQDEEASVAPKTRLRPPRRGGFAFEDASSHPRVPHRPRLVNVIFVSAGPLWRGLCTHFLLCGFAAQFTVAMVRARRWSTPNRLCTRSQRWSKCRQCGLSVPTESKRSPDTAIARASTPCKLTHSGDTSAT